MAYKFQLGAYTASGSLKQEGALECETSLTIGSAAMSEADLEKLDGITNGTVAANKAVVVDASKDISAFNSLTAVALTSSATITSAGAILPAADDGAALGSASRNWSDLFLADGAVINFGDDQEIKLTHTHDQGLTLGSAVSDAPMFILQSTNADSEGATMAIQKDSASPADGDEIGNIEFYGDDDGGNVTLFAQIQVTAPDVSDASEDGAFAISTMIGGSSVEILDINKTAASTITVKDGAYDFDVASHDGSNGLKLGGSLVVATAAQINQLSSGAVTSVSSLLATDIKIGEDDQTKIDFADANKINFHANNVKELVLEENKLTPGSNDGIALGDSSLGFSDLYLADGGAIEFGNDQDHSLRWSAADKLQVSSSASDFAFEVLGSHSDANGVAMVLHRSSSSPADLDVIGQVEFRGYDDGGSLHQYGAIKVSTLDVSAGAEQGKMELQVAEFDGTATAGLILEGQSSNGIINVTVGAGAASTTTIAGNLTVNGTTTTVDTTNLLVKDKLITLNDGGSAGSAGASGIEFEEDGSATGFIKTAADRAGFEFQAPGNSNTLTIDATATKTLTVGGNFNIDADITANASEINLLDAGAGSSVSLQGADGIIIFDADSGNNAAKVLVSDITAIASTSISVALKDNTETLANGVNYFANLGGAESCNLPSSPSVGDVVYVKAPANCNSTNTLTINIAGGGSSHLIDGENAIVLESPHSAVMLVYVVANVWKVF